MAGGGGGRPSFRVGIVRANLKIAIFKGKWNWSIHAITQNGPGRSVVPFVTEALEVGKKKPVLSSFERH